MIHTLPKDYLLSNRYTITRLIGQGGFGITYEARDEKLDMKVCIKELFVSGNSTRSDNFTVLSQTTANFDFGEFVQRFIEEARQLAKFNHPNIVRVLDIFQENRTAYMVMEYVEGETLKEHVSDKGIMQKEASFYIMFQLLEAVETVHKSGMLHRDIKPDNVLLSSENRVVLIDFGSARAFTEGKTSTQTTMLTPGYAPPEQYSDRAKRGPFTDIYALGATFYFLLTGEKPLTVTDRVNEEMPAPHVLNPAVDSRVSSAIMLAMQLKPEERFQTVSDFKKALLQVTEGTSKSTEKTEILKKNLSPIEKEDLEHTREEKHGSTLIKATQKTKTTPSKIALISVSGLLLLLLLWWAGPLLFASKTETSENSEVSEEKTGESSQKKPENAAFEKVAGKCLYYSVYPKIGDGMTPYQKFYFLKDGRLLGHANLTGFPGCPTMEVFIGNWKLKENTIYGTYLIHESSSSKKVFHNLKIMLEELDDLDNLVLRLGKEWWEESGGSPVNRENYDMKISFEKNNAWAFHDMHVLWGYERKFPESSKRKLSEVELKSYSKSELRIMRNEIFVQYGYNFERPDLRKYFKNAACLHFENVDAMLSPLEIENVKTIKKVEDSLEAE